MAADGYGNPSPAPKILLAKPGLVTSGKFNRGGADEEAALRSRLSSIASLNLLSDTWDFQTDRFLPFLTDNAEFTVVGVIGPPGVGKSTILNEIYGSDSSSPGMLPPFGVESEETRAMAKHCTVGIEPRISSERIILLDTQVEKFLVYLGFSFFIARGIWTVMSCIFGDCVITRLWFNYLVQPVFSPSVLAEMIRPDGSSTLSVISGESLSAELAHEVMSIQLGILLASICHVVMVVSNGVRDASMWRLMLTVDLLKHGIPDPSCAMYSHPQSLTNFDKLPQGGEEYIATPIFVHMRVRDRDITPHNYLKMKKALAECFRSSSFIRSEGQKDGLKESQSSVTASENAKDLNSDLELFLVPSQGKDDSSRPQHESYMCALWKIRDQVLSMNGPSFSRTVSERDWLKNSAKIWELIKNSPTIGDYCTTLKSSCLFRKS